MSSGGRDVNPAVGFIAGFDSASARVLNCTTSIVLAHPWGASGSGARRTRESSTGEEEASATNDARPRGGEGDDERGFLVEGAAGRVSRGRGAARRRAAATTRLGPDGAVDAEGARARVVEARRHQA